jgi:hypothetical protein
MVVRAILVTRPAVNRITASSNLVDHPNFAGLPSGEASRGYERKRQSLFAGSDSQANDKFEMAVHTTPETESIRIESGA